MARWLAIEWDDREARVAVASGRGAEFLLEQAFIVGLHPERPDQTPEEIGGKLSAALSARGLTGRMECLIALGRSNLELRHLSLPPAPDDELPEMVRFQALREFNTLGEDWPLDYLPTSGSDTEPRSVLAAAISPELVGQIAATSKAAGLRPQRLILRACAAASLLRRSRLSTERVRLLVDLLSDEADLTVLVDNKVVFLRTARLPGEPGSAEQARALTAEIRRTMLAAQNRLDGGKVEAIYLCGSESAHAAWCAQIRQELGIPAHVFDPFSGQTLGSELKAAIPAHPGRFAPLIGLLADECTGTPHDLDFLHPRRKPEAPSRRNQFAIIGAVAAILIVGLGVWLMLAAAERRAELASLNDQLKALSPKLKELDELNVRMAALNRWQVDDVVWIDELKNLSKNLPDNKEVMLTQFQTRATLTGSEVTLDGVVRQPSGLGNLESKLRDDKHRVTPKGDKKSDNTMYTWEFKSMVNIVTDLGLAIEKQKAATTKAPVLRGPKRATP